MTKGVKVLVIDDDAPFLKVMSFWLRTKGYSVTTATNGSDGVSAVKKGGLDLVLMDFKMPDMSGLEALAKIREFNKTIPVVVVTAFADDAIVREIRRYSISGLFSKLEEIGRLQQTLDVVLRGVRRRAKSSERT